MIAALVTLLAAHAPADGPIASREFVVDAPAGPVIGSHRVTGLAGACTSIAEGSESADFNPAAYGVRHPYSLDSWDWDLHLDWLLVGLGGDIDFENNGRNPVAGDLGVVRGGFDVQVGEWGGRISIAAHDYYAGEWRWSYGDTVHNASWTERRATRAPPADRRYPLAALDLVVNGAASGQATGLEGLLAQELEVAGRSATLSLRAGVESEVWSDRVVVRTGTYLEPTRFEAGSARLHHTVGAEVRLFRLWRWQLRAATTFDYARDYRNLLVGIGFWH